MNVDLNIDFNTIIFVAFTVGLIFARFKLAQEIKETCSHCSNSVNRPKRQGLYKVKYIIIALSYISMAMAIFSMAKR